MDEIIFAVVLVVFIFLSPFIISIRALIKTKKIPILENEIKMLKKEISTLKDQFYSNKIIVSESKDLLESTILSTEKSVEIASIEPIQKNNEKDKMAFNFQWKWNQERIFAFLGAFLGIIGLVFFTLYLGTQIGIILRFFIMTGFAAIFLLISYPLKKRDRWVEMAHISRSLSGALFLFAVFASSTIEGLKWIENPLFALLIISVGSFYNIILGGFCKKRAYTVFHLSINYLVIFLLPTDPLVFTLAFVLTMGLQVFGLFKKENINRSLSFLFFAVYCIYFKGNGEGFWYLSLTFNSLALITFISQILQSEKKDLLNRISIHLIPALWIIIAYVLNFSLISSLIPLCLGIFGGLFINSDRKFKVNNFLQWPLQLLVMGTLLNIAIKVEGSAYWLTLLYLETSFFTFSLIKEKRDQNIALLINYLVLISTLIYLYLSRDYQFLIVSIANNLILITSASLFTYKLAIYADQKEKDFKTFLSIFNFLLSIFVLSLTLRFDSAPQVSDLFVLIIYTIPLFVFCQKDSLKMRAYGLWTLSLIALIAILNHISHIPPIYLVNNFNYFLPLLLLNLVMVFYFNLRKAELYPNYGVFLLTLIALFTIYFSFHYITSILPAILVLILSLVYLFWWGIDKQWEVQASGLLLLFIFFVRHITHTLQMENYWYFINIRLLIEIGAIAVFYMYLRSSNWNINHKIPILNKSLKVSSFLLFWFFIILFIFSHSNRNLLSLVLQLSVVVFLYMDKKGYLPTYPLVPVAYVHFILAQLNLSLNSHPRFPFLPDILQNPWIFGFINLGTSIFVIFVFFRHFKTNKNEISPEFGKLINLEKLLKNKKNQVLLIPLFVSLALFFNWTLEETALTIAFFCGSFLLYGTALILRENTFRHATSLALLGTSIRLIFWDLAQSSMLAKAMAFLGASIIFILINILYAYFKGRFENV